MNDPDTSHHRRLTLLYVIGTLDIGGTERQLVEIATRLAGRGHVPIVCCLGAGGPLVEPLRAAGVRVEALAFTRSGDGSLRSLLLSSPAIARKVWRLVELIRRERPDVVHGLLFHAYVLTAFAGRLAGARVIVASRRSLAIFKRDKRHYRVLEWLANRLTTLVIANSEAVRADTLASERIAARKVITIHNGLDPSTLETPDRETSRRQLGLPADAQIAVVVANLIPYKGHEYFLAAWTEIARRFPRAHALLVGDGQLRATIERRIVEPGLDGAITLLGTRRDVGAILAAADLVVHPSLEEGFPNAILEGMAAGRPIVATSVGGIPEAVVDGETGLLVSPRDPAALACAIGAMFDDPAAAAEMGRRGRARVLERFGIDRMVEAYEHTYRRLLG